MRAKYWGDGVLLHKLRLAAVILAVPCLTATANAQEFSFSDLFAAPATVSGWTATVARAAGGVKDPTWTAVVAVRRGSSIETGSVVAHAMSSPGPRLMGAPHMMNGVASFYSMDQMTASGEVFNKREMTAAHKTLPMGSKVQVTNLDNGRTAVVRINDRGPYIAGRVIDVSEAAADVLGMRSMGVAPVRVDMVGQ